MKAVLSHLSTTFTSNILATTGLLATFILTQGSYRASLDLIGKFIRIDNPQSIPRPHIDRNVLTADHRFGVSGQIENSGKAKATEVEIKFSTSGVLETPGLFLINHQETLADPTFQMISVKERVWTSLGDITPGDDPLSFIFWYPDELAMSKVQLRYHDGQSFEVVEFLVQQGENDWPEAFTAGRFTTHKNLMAFRKFTAESIPYVVGAFVGLLFIINRKFIASLVGRFASGLRGEFRSLFRLLRSN